MTLLLLFIISSVRIRVHYIRRCFSEFCSPLTLSFSPCRSLFTHDEVIRKMHVQGALECVWMERAWARDKQKYIAKRRVNWKNKMHLDSFGVRPLRLLLMLFVLLMRTRNFSFHYFYFIFLSFCFHFNLHSWKRLIHVVQQHYTGTHTIGSYMVSQLEVVLYLGVVWLAGCGYYCFCAQSMRVIHSVSSEWIYDVTSRYLSQFDDKFEREQKKEWIQSQSDGGGGAHMIHES